MKTYREIAGDGGSDILGQVAEQQVRLRARMAQITHKLAIMSGKGGVGKSVVTANLAVTLARSGLKVGVLDADINGPSIAKMLGVQEQSLEISNRDVVPIHGPLDIKVISMDLLLPQDETPVVWDAPTQHDPFIWRGAIEVSTLREFLADTDWGELDFLLIDLPPGPDRLPNISDLLPDLCAIVVTIPSEVAQRTVKKSVVLVQELKVPLIGLVENMAGYLCPQCGALGELFPGDGKELAKALDMAFLGKIPFDPQITRCFDQGVPFMIAHGETPAGRAFAQIAEKIEAFLNGRER
ncbi:MAG: Mrp/NBP35 family ATP-binding protein [Candidatus Bipolaricaulia bacterium]